MDPIEHTSFDAKLDRILASEPELLRPTQPSGVDRRGSQTATFLASALRLTQAGFAKQQHGGHEAEPGGAD
jgi:hypothetical protein